MGGEQRRGGTFSGRAALTADTAQATALPELPAFPPATSDHGRIDLQICDTTRHSGVRRTSVGSGRRLMEQCMQRTWAGANGAQGTQGRELPAKLSALESLK